jgi:hypothetical protein
MSSSSRLSPIPPFRGSPGASVPEFKALAVGINYISRPDGLKGPINDAKDVKNFLKGGHRYLVQPFLPLNHNMAAIADTYHFPEQNITLMTDEEQNRGRGLWPSAKNIVSFFPHRDTWSHVL